MTRTEVIGVLAVIGTAYPNFFKGKSEAQKREAIRVYEDFFEDDPGELVYAAVKSLIADGDSGFAPTIGEIRSRMRELMYPDELSESQAWALVSKACQRALYHAQEEFDKLPCVVKAAVGNPAQLREWAMVDESAFQSVVGSNFQRSYRTHVKRERAAEMLPESVKAMLSSIAQRPALEAGEESKA